MVLTPFSHKLDSEVDLVNKIVLIVCFILVCGTVILVFNTITAPSYQTIDNAKIDISSDPIQLDPTEDIVPPIVSGSYKHTIIPKASYTISAMVVSTRRYRRGYMSKLSPFDYALIWGRVPEYLPYIEFDQIVRFCLFRAKNPELVDLAYISTHMSNNHLIPASDNIGKALSKAREHDLVRLEGYLVNVISQDKNNNFGYWNSSMSRKDYGNGACEIIYVKSLRINDRLYE